MKTFKSLYGCGHIGIYFSESSLWHTSLYPDKRINLLSLLGQSLDPSYIQWPRDHFYLIHSEICCKELARKRLSLYNPVNYISVLRAWITFLPEAYVHALCTYFEKHWLRITYSPPYIGGKTY